MKHKEKGIFIGHENTVKCVTITTDHIHVLCFYITMTVENSKINVRSSLYLYLYSFVKIGD